MTPMHRKQKKKEEAAEHTMGIGAHHGPCDQGLRIGVYHGPCDQGLI